MRTIKWAWQRLTRGYDDRVKWGFDEYFLQVMPALKEFCQEEIEIPCTKLLNPGRYAIFTETLEYIDAYEKMRLEDWYKGQNAVARLLEFVGRNIGYYWD